MAKSKNSKCQNFDGFHLNPFVNKDFTIEISVLTDNKTFISKNGILEPKEYEFERQLSTKVYRSAVIRDDLMKLKANAHRMWIWIQQTIEPAKAEFKLNKKTYKLSNPKNSSTNTIKQALQELQDNKFIAVSDRKDIYFVNPVYLFSGNRTKAHPEHTEIYKPENPRTKKE